MKKKYNISIVGQSTTGKSTLINYLCDKYVTAESKKLQKYLFNLYKFDREGPEGWWVRIILKVKK